MLLLDGSENAPIRNVRLRTSKSVRFVHIIHLSSKSLTMVSLRCLHDYVNNTVYGFKIKTIYTFNPQRAICTNVFQTSLIIIDLKNKTIDKLYFKPNILHSMVYILSYSSIHPMSWAFTNKYIVFSSWA